MKVLICLFFLIVFFVQVHAQNYEFCVLGKIGTALVQNFGSKSRNELKTGDQLRKNDIITLKENSYLGLVHSSGKTIEIRKSGEYKISKLKDELLGNKSTSVIPNLIEIIFGNKSNMKDLLDSKKSKKIYSKGSIERSLDVEQFVIMSPKKMILIGKDIELIWSKYSANNKYEIKITDRFNKTIFTKVTEDTLVKINQNELKLEKDQYYFWKVNLLSIPQINTDEGYFLFMSDSKISEIRKNVEQLQKNLSDKETPVTKILLAFYYENNLLVEEADREFKEAIELSPGVSDYKELYEAFKMRINIKR
ncbi:MAG: hypothetical protein HZB41_12105 [Ignavibacteriae bacterium]|nr:hypothetical protein [Ignavibacteriota bacterium]